MKRARLFIIIGLLITIAVSGVIVTATCIPSDFGTAGNDTIDCTVANPPLTAVAGLDGDDTITIGAGVNIFSVSGGEVFGGNESGNDTILNDGVITGDLLGDTSSGIGSGSDTLINNGTVNGIEGDTGNGLGSGNDIIVNNGSVTGTIDGDTGFGIGSGNDTIVNNGTVDTIFADSADGSSFGSDTVTNNGYVVSNLYGDGSGGNSDGSDTIVNNGTVGNNIYGDGDFGVGTGNDNITNNGSAGNIIATGGNDTITNNGTVNGDISAGDGDDTVIIAAGTAVVGDGMDGGNGYDILTFNLNTTDPAELEAAAALLAAQSPAGGTVTIGGRTYTWVNFEELTQLLNLLRLNGVADPLALFCAAAGGIDVYAVSNDQGFFALFVSLQQISSGVAHAQEIGDEVLVAFSNGASVYALGSGELRVEAANGFAITLSATRCGELPEPLPFIEVIEEVEDTLVIINRAR